MENTLISIGKSCLRDAKEAGIDAATEALAGLKNLPPRFALIFATAGYNQEELLKSITQIIGDIPSSGCSGEGIITPSGSDESSTSLGIMLFAGDKINFHNYICQNLKKDSYGCGEDLAKAYDSFYQQISSSANKFGTILVLPDSLTVNITALFKAFDTTTKTKPLVLGGTAGDMMQLKKTYQYHNGKVYSDALSAAFIVGEYEIDWLVSHGCEEIGVEHTVTKADKNCVLSIDDEKAWAVMQKYIPTHPTEYKAEDFFHFCLGEIHHFDKPIPDQLLIRTPMGLAPGTDGLIFSVEIPEGTDIHITRRDPEVIAEKVITAFKDLLQRNQNKKILGVLQFDCAGRGLVIYGKNLNKLIFEPLQKLVPATTPWLGFHTFGELAPLFGKNFYHNFTAVIGIIFDK
ncbi:MAG: FIST C-terminal domain-containing protein [Gammaproteobacteria bacterium]|nr:FIST C-terminal domain-containing protein [Gammaproteobacteria bacterium]